MSDPAVLSQPSEVTSDWLSEVLGSPVEVTAIELITDVGLVSQVARVRLQSDTAPSSVIVKTAPLDKNFAARMAWAFEGETYFYREVGHRCGIPIPQCWYSAYVQRDNRGTIVMEDLDPLVPGDMLFGLTREQTLAAIRPLASMHARHWRAVEDWPFLLTQGRAWDERMMSHRDGVASVLSRYGDRLSPATVELLPRIAERLVDAEVVARSRENATLVHADYHGGNIAFGAGPSDLKVFDWQAVMAAAPGIDLVKLIFTGLSVDSRRSFGDAALAMYRTQMEGAGVAIDAGELNRLISDALLHQICQCVRIASVAAEGSHLLQSGLKIFERMGAALDDGW